MDETRTALPSTRGGTRGVYEFDLSSAAKIARFEVGQWAAIVRAARPKHSSDSVFGVGNLYLKPGQVWQSRTDKTIRRNPA